MVTREGAPLGTVSLSVVEGEYGPRIVEGLEHVDGELDEARREMQQRTLDAWKTR